MKLAKQQIALQFSRAAKTYDEVSQLQREMADQLITKAIDSDLWRRRFENGITIADLGCGTGYALERFAKSLSPTPVAANLVGIDIAPGMVEAAQKRNFEIDAPSQIEIQVGDIEATGLAEDSVDIVFSNAAIQWCELSKALNEFSRILKPEGLMVASTFGPQTLNEWKTAWLAVGDDSSRIHDFHSKSLVETESTLAGFVELEIWSQCHLLEHESVPELFHSIKKLGATNAAIDRPKGFLRPSVYRELCRYFEGKLQKQGNLQTTFESIFIVAKNREEIQARRENE